MTCDNLINTISVQYIGTYTSIMLYRLGSAGGDFAVGFAGFSRLRVFLCSGKEGMNSGSQAENIAKINT